MRLIAMLVCLASVAFLCLPLLAVAGDGKEKPQDEITVTLHYPGETKYSVIKKHLEKLGAIQKVKLFVRVPEKDKGVYADISATDVASPKSLSAVVEELLRVGVPKISLEVKK